MAATAPETNEDIRAEILAAQQAFEEDFKKQGLYVTHGVKYRYALALSKSTDKEDWMLARWCVLCAIKNAVLLVLCVCALDVNAQLF